MKRLNRELWLKHVKQIEAEILAMKLEMHRPDYQETFNYWKLMGLKAEATRMYCLRTMFRTRKHEVAACGRYWVGPGNWLKTRSLSYRTDWTPEQILASEPGWMDQYLVEVPEPVAVASGPVLNGVDSAGA